MQEWQVGDVIGARFEVRGHLGHGSFGEVLAVHDRQDQGALKALKLLGKDRGPFDREIAAARRAAGHPRLLVADEGMLVGGRLALLLPHSSGQPLANWLLAQSDLPRIRSLISSLLLSLTQLTAELHALGVAHDDLGFGNIMVSDGSTDVVELIDFGTSVCSDGPPAEARQRPNAFYGRRLHAANFALACADDVRALAVLIVLSLARRHPFSDEWQPLLTGGWMGPDPFEGTAQVIGLDEPLASGLRAALGPAESRPCARDLAACFKR